MRLAHALTLRDFAFFIGNTALVAGVVASLVAFDLGNDPGENDPALQYFGRTDEEPSKYTRAPFDLHQLAASVELYQWRHGDLPTDLSTLDAANLHLVDPWGHAYRYERTDSGEGFKVVTLGRDDKAGGELADEDQSAP